MAKRTKRARYAAALLGLASAAGLGCVSSGLRLGCPSDEELRRPLSDEVRAFRNEGILLLLVTRRGRIAKYRYEEAGARVWVNVCSELCQPDDGLIAKRRPRVGPAMFVRNIGVAVVGDSTAGRPLLGKVHALSTTSTGRTTASAATSGSRR